VLVSLFAICAGASTLLCPCSEAAVVPTERECGALPGVRSLARVAVPGARTAIIGAVARVSGEGATVPGAEAVPLSAESCHLVREFADAPLKHSIVRWLTSARERR
jgi:hypothetical protein